MHIPPPTPEEEVFLAAIVDTAPTLQLDRGDLDPLTRRRIKRARGRRISQRRRVAITLAAACGTVLALFSLMRP